ncbi:MAG TPA: sugar phosphate isomerase/epimerase family protein [Feifaniaceae bacterium]|nr:sugar phosphate isomerase/epimerase family protein [Feifaniaceae bacterium]
MKVSVAIADAKAEPFAFVVWRGFAESMEKAAQLGYQGVELALRSREDIDADELRSLLKKYKLEVSCISTGQVFASLGLTMTDVDDDRRGRAVQVLSGLVELASEFGGMVNLGRVRGFVAEGRDIEHTETLFLDSLGKLLPLAEKHGVLLVVEPVNRYETNFINSLPECAVLLKKVGSVQIGIMADVFHMNIEDARIGETIVECASMLRYVHLADSNRLAPGWGHLDFGEVFGALGQCGYNGWMTVECLPHPTPDAAARQAMEFLLPMVRAYNNAKRRI